MFGNFNNSFKTLITSSLILSASFFVQNSSALAGGFTETCEDIDLVSGFVLRAKCRNENDDKVFNAIDLNKYIVNINAAFDWQLNGNYIASCREIRLLPAPRFGKLFLGAICRDPRGNEERAVIDLNERISNQNGILAVDGF